LYAGLIEIKDHERNVDYLIRKFHDYESLQWKRRERPRMIANSKKNGIKELMEAQRQLVSIASFSKRNDIALMWSYYAKSHTGIVIGYNFPHGGIKVGGDAAFLHELEYMEDIKTIDAIPGIPEPILKWVLTKSFDWKHEKELRLVRFETKDPEGNQFFNHHPQHIVKISFGINTSQSDIKDILQILDENYPNHEIEFTKMEIGTELFTIKEVPFTP